MKYYDTVPRKVRTKYGKVKNSRLVRMKCESCGHVQRVVSDEILPYKMYEREIIFMVLDGIIDSDTLGFENYPHEITMARWRSQILQSVL